MKTTTPSNMSLSELQGRLKIFGRQALSLCGRTADGQPLGVAVKKFFDEALTATTDPEKIRQRNEFLARAETDPVTKRQLCGIRVETLNNYILASINIMAMFFDIVTLADDERPAVQNTTDQEIFVSYIGLDGGHTLRKVVKDDDETLINLKMLTTERVRYRRVDIYRGTIVDAALKTLRLAYDLKNQMDAKCYSLLTDATQGAFGAFIYPGSVAGAGAGSGTVPPAHFTDYTFLPNSRILIGNLPPTNDISLSDNSASTTFRYEVLRAIDRYFNQWRGSFIEGDLEPTGRILIPGLDASDIASEIVPSGNTNNKVADELLERGYTRINYLGREWTLVGDNTLTPGSCLVESNRKAGRVYLKPTQDRDMVRGEDVYELAVNNEEERWSQKVFGAYINNALRPNVLRVKYRNP